MPSSLQVISRKSNSLQASSLKANSLKAIRAGFALKHRAVVACDSRFGRTEGGRGGGDLDMGGGAWRRRSRQGVAALCRRRRVLGHAVADAACRPDGVAGLFRDGVQGSSRPQGCLRRSADPRLWRHRGEYRLLYVFLCQGWRDQEPARALQLHLRQERRELAHRRPPFLGDATAPEIANSK